MENNDILKIEHVTKRFPGVVALNDVSFAIKAGEVHGLVGENGAGKSTLIKAIMGIHPIDEGSITLWHNGAYVQPKNALEVKRLGMYANQVEFQMNAGIAGIFCNGLSGESLYMTKEEKIAVTKVAVEKAGGKLPVIGNIAEMRPVEAREMLDAYVEAGVDGICTTQPSVFGYGNDALIKFYNDLARATTLPVYIYNAPQTNNTMSPDVIAEIMKANDNVIGYKDSTQDIIHLQTLKAAVPEDKHFECVADSDATIYPTLAVSGCG